MRVLFLTWRDLEHPQAGGSEVVVDRLAVELVRRGHDVTVLSGGPVGARVYEAHDLGGPFQQYLRAPIAYWRRYRRCDVIIDVSNGLPFFAPLWSRRPTLLLVHHVHRDQWRQRFGPALTRVGWFAERVVVPRLYRRHRVLAVSASTRDDLVQIGFAAQQISAIDLGVDVPQTVGPKSAEPLFVFLGRLVSHKRVDIILRVWDRVRATVGGRLVIAGDGPDRERLQALAGPGVEFVGHQSDKAKDRLLAEAWLLVVASHHEGWGVVVMEAAARGTPTLALDAPGVRDAVQDGITGCLTADEDDLARVWTDLVDDEDRRRSLGKTARCRAVTLTWARTADQLLDAVALERQ
jgi:glycosyltransferase involved in cell wall biosynthesis